MAPIRRRLLKDLQQMGGAELSEVTRNGGVATTFFSDFTNGLSRAAKDLVVSSGFGLVLYIARYKPDLKLAAWLLLNYDSDKSVVVLDDGTELPVPVEACQFILGLRTGKPFLAAEDAIRTQRDNGGLVALFEDMLPAKRSRPTPCVSVDMARHQLLKMKGYKKFSPKRARLFVASLVIVSVLYVLWPRKGKKYVGPEVAAAIHDEERPSAYNWADFTLQSLRSASAEFKEAMTRAGTAVNIHVPGCSVVLVLLYLMKMTTCNVQYERCGDPLLSKFSEVYSNQLILCDQPRRQKMPSYCIIAASTKVDRESIQRYLEARKISKRVMAIPGWDIENCCKIDDGDNLMTVIKRYLDPRFDALDKALQTILQHASNDNRQSPQKAACEDNNEPWCRQLLLEEVCRRTIQWLSELPLIYRDTVKNTKACAPGAIQATTELHRDTIQTDDVEQCIVSEDNLNDQSSPSKPDDSNKREQYNKCGEVDVPAMSTPSEIKQNIVNVPTRVTTPVFDKSSRAVTVHRSAEMASSRRPVGPDEQTLITTHHFQNQWPAVSHTSDVTSVQIRQLPAKTRSSKRAACDLTTYFNLTAKKKRTPRVEVARVAGDEETPTVTAAVPEDISRAVPPAFEDTPRPIFDSTNKRAPPVSSTKGNKRARRIQGRKLFTDE